MIRGVEGWWGGKKIEARAHRFNRDIKLGIWLGVGGIRSHPSSTAVTLFEWLNWWWNALKRMDVWFYTFLCRLESEWVCDLNNVDVDLYFTHFGRWEDQLLPSISFIPLFIRPFMHLHPTLTQDITSLSFPSLQCYPTSSASQYYYQTNFNPKDSTSTLHFPFWWLEICGNITLLPNYKYIKPSNLRN